MAREHAIQQLYDALCKVGRPLQGYIQHGHENLSNAASFTDYYVAVNEKLTAPSVEPQSTGYPNRVFLGWYEDAECTKVWDFANKTVTTDVTLYAKWANAKTVTLKFVYYAPDDDATPIDYITMTVPVIEVVSLVTVFPCCRVHRRKAFLIRIR